MIVSTESVVLNSRKFGDTSKIVTFYTKEGGLIKAVAKGSRASKNKFGSSLEPLSHSFISYYEKPEKDLFLLSKAETINPFRKITDSIVCPFVIPSGFHHHPSRACAPGGSAPPSFPGWKPTHSLVGTDLRAVRAGGQESERR